MKHYKDAQRLGRVAVVVEGGGSGTWDLYRSQSGALLCEQRTKWGQSLAALDPLAVRRLRTLLDVYLVDELLDPEPDGRLDALGERHPIARCAAHAGDGHACALVRGHSGSHWWSVEGARRWHQRPRATLTTRRPRREDDL